MKILYFYNEEWEKDYVSQNLTGHELHFVAGPLAKGVYPEAEVISLFVNSKLTGADLEAWPNLKLVATRSTGFDHLDLPALKAKGIDVASVPTYGENTVAEFAFALLLALSRIIYDAYHQLAEKGLYSQKELTGFDLKGKTIGVVGTGHIGAHSIKIAKGFEMNVIAFDVMKNEKLATELGFSYAAWDDLLAQSDIITFHAPYLPATHHMFNKASLAKLKPGAYIINTARGGLIETAALVEGLEKGIIGGAGLDVLEEEGALSDELKLLHEPHPQAESLQTLLANHYFIKHPRVIVTPHNAFNTKEAITRILDTTIANIQGFTTGKPQNLVK
jgi:D-lactate dehydrogenase